MYDYSSMCWQSFCRQLHHNAITVPVDDEIITQMTKENFTEFWNEHIGKGVGAERRG